MLRLYMDNVAPRFHAPALLELGEAQLCLGKTEQALQSFQECIKHFPTNVAIYRRGSWPAAPPCKWRTSNRPRPSCRTTSTASN